MKFIMQKLRPVIFILLVLVMPFLAKSQNGRVYSATYTFNIYTTSLNDNTDPPDISDKIDYVNHTTNVPANSFELFSFKKNNQKFIMGCSKNGGQLFIERQYETNNLTNSTINGFYAYTLFNTKVRLKNGFNTLKFQVQDSLIWITTANSTINTPNLIEGNGIGEGVLYVNNDMELFNKYNAYTTINISSIISSNYQAVFSYVSTPVQIVTRNLSSSTAEDFVYEEYNYGEDAVTLPLQLGNALNFDGVNDNIAIANGYAATSDLTYEAWVNPQNLTNTFSVIMNHNGWSTGYVHFQFHGNKLGFDINGGNDNACTYNFSTNTWYHVAAVYSATAHTLVFYVNGNLINTISNANFPPIPASLPMTIGAWSNSRYFSGTIDEVRIWKVARTQAQIQANMSKPISTDEIGLVGYFQFNEGKACATNTDVTLLPNLTSIANNGTLNNFALSGSTSNWVPGVTPSSTYSICVGTNLQITNGITSGTWSSNNTTVATVSTNGLVTGLVAGTVTINYTYTLTGNSCPSISSTIVTVNALPSVAAIAGKNSVFIGSNTQLSDATIGGAWSSSNASVATVNNTGLVVGLSPGSTIINYTVANINGCSAKSNLTINAQFQSCPSTLIAGANNAKQLSVGANGTVCMIGSDNRIYKWNGTSWIAYPNTYATKLAVDKYGIPWHIGTGGAIFTWINGAWSYVRTAADASAGLAIVGSNIACGADGSVFIVDLNSSNIPTVYKWDPNSSYPHGLVPYGTATNATSIRDLAVDNLGSPWIIDNVQSNIHKWVNGQIWQEVAGSGFFPNNLACGADGSVFLESSTVSHYVSIWNGNSWIKVTDFSPASTDIGAFSYNSIVKIDNGQVYKSSCLTPNVSSAIAPALTTIQITQDASSTIRIYPNPAHDKITVQLAAGMETATVAIISPLGNTVATDNNTGLQRVINLLGKPSGTYLVRATTKEGVSTTRKIIVQ